MNKAKTGQRKEGAFSQSSEKQSLVARMQGFYQLNGFYRPEDVTKVLGDPRKTVSIEVLEHRPTSRLHKS